ncbi:hypothetical protein [Mesorhizobium sp. M0965]|uniref:hypothetical protein n=1 Tax=unclassified Mesorhizobium TaxID=325217 RepID=UPI00333643E1
MSRLYATLGPAVLCATFILGGDVSSTGRSAVGSWDDLPTVNMKGGLQVFWDVHDSSKGANAAIASEHGFAPVTIVNTFADYPGGQKENIRHTLGRRPNNNPWARPGYFERIVRRNVSKPTASEIWVNDIEFPIELDVSKAWRNTKVREASKAKDEAEFATSYFREWSKWYALPSKWTKEAHPDIRVGIYGRQLFDRDYWGLYSLSEKELKEKHSTELEIWKNIDDYVDFYVSSVYIFYRDPGSVYYVAGNVEENVRLGRSFGDKPVYAYEWLRFHDSNWLEGKDELDPYLVEALAIVPYFFGAKGIVLWGSEPQIKEAGIQPYRTLGLFMTQLNRVAAIATLIEGGQPAAKEEAVQRLWQSKQPLVRTIVTKSSSCVVMAVNPWQDENKTSLLKSSCMDNSLNIPLRGRHVTIVEYNNGVTSEY